MLPPWAMITPCAPPVGHLDLGRDGVRLVLDADDRALGQAAHAAVQELAVALHERRPSGELGDEALGDAVVERQDVVLGRLDQEQPLQLGELLGLLLRTGRSACVQSLFVS